MSDIATSSKRKLPEGMIKRGKVYYAWFRYKGRLVRKKLSADLNSARDILKELQGRLARGDWGLLDNDCSWEEVKRVFFAWAKQEVRDCDQYIADILRFEKYMTIRSINQINKGFVVGYREWRLAQRAGRKPGKGKPDTRPFVTPRTVNREVCALRSMLEQAVEHDLIGGNPLKNIDSLVHDSPAKVRRALGVEEIRTLFKVLPEYLKPILRFIMTTGVRKDEAVELLWSDIDFESRTVTIRANVAKNKKAREILLDDEMVAILETERDAAHHRQPVVGTTIKKTVQQAASFSRDHVFVTRANTPWRNNLLKRFYLYAQKAGIADAKPRGAVDIHSLRVTFTTLCIDGGASPKAVQDIVGHSTLALTMNVYAKATDRSKRDAIAVLPFSGISAPDHLIELRSTAAREKSKVYTGSDTSLSGERKSSSVIDLE